MMQNREDIKLFDRVQKAALQVVTLFKHTPQIAIVLGSGLGAFAEDLHEPSAMDYQDIPGFARSTVPGHAGRLVVGSRGGIWVLVMQGRFHYYEGYSFAEVTFPIRMFNFLGIKSLILTNAAGGINVSFEKGALMVISDHLNLMGTNPLRGANDDRFGSRFPDMSEVYSRAFQEIAVEEAHAMNLELRRGIYAGLAGPSYETPAEIRMLRTLGADAVGMSTVPEAIVARHGGMKILGISCITNVAAGLSEQPINHEEVIEEGTRNELKFKELLGRVIPRIAANPG